ncbi:PDZ domain-containing protein [Luteolibacter arcticus]|uniref:PDZ domain-containing protein n=1 Tax=Luteolibacter arcticus TaxID=1581411 RepID=A0ABT3GCX3_9BACT|nr:PDZ domain-containing protein [Luteolibacter arcticus]MCW1921464.1 PDZ domain-containing protein [Luteolibacter arcticus]
MKTTLAFLALPFLSVAPLSAQVDPSGPGQDLHELFDKMHREGATEEELRKLLADRSDKALLIEPEAPQEREREHQHPQPDRPAPEAPAWRVGLLVEPLLPFVRDHFGLDRNEGVRVVEVANGSPAHRLGIKVNDIVLSAGDKAISTLEDLRQVVERAGRAGQAFKLSWIHRGERKSAQVRPQGPPPAEAEKGDEGAAKRPAIMHRMEEMARRMERQQREIEELRREIEKLKRESRDDEE